MYEESKYDLSVTNLKQLIEEAITGEITLKEISEKTKLSYRFIDQQVKFIYGKSFKQLKKIYNEKIGI